MGLLSRTKAGGAAVICLKDRNINMLKNDLALRNPLRLMGTDTDKILSEGAFGAVLARAGVGKTAMIVQIALDNLLSGRNVLHISLDEPVHKVTLWYREVFSFVARQYNVKQASQLWNAVLPHRFIMTFKVDGFSVPRFEERLTDLTAQNIFEPRLMIFDGLPFHESVDEDLSALKHLCQKRSMSAWFSVTTHRHEPPGTGGLPPQIESVAELFDVLIQLVPEGRRVHVKALKGASLGAEQRKMELDPSTMLIKS